MRDDFMENIAPEQSLEEEENVNMMMEGDISGIGMTCVKA